MNHHIKSQEWQLCQLFIFHNENIQFLSVVMESPRTGIQATEKCLFLYFFFFFVVVISVQFSYEDTDLNLVQWYPSYL